MEDIAKLYTEIKGNDIVPEGLFNEGFKHNKKANDLGLSDKNATLIYVRFMRAMECIKRYKEEEKNLRKKLDRLERIMEDIKYLVIDY